MAAGVSSGGAGDGGGDGASPAGAGAALVAIVAQASAKAPRNGRRPWRARGIRRNDSPEIPEVMLGDRGRERLLSNPAFRARRDGERNLTEEAVPSSSPLPSPQRPLPT